MLSGTLVHAALAGEIPEDNLDPSDHDKVVKLRHNEGDIELHYMERGWAKIDHTLEERYWYNVNTHLKEGMMMMSGKPDVVNLYKSTDYGDESYHIVIVDYKSGQTGPSMKAENNAQLEALVGILHQLCDFKVTSWETWIVHTEGSSGAIYGEEEAWDIRQSLDHELQTIRFVSPVSDKKPQLNLGDHCLWCNAKGICSEAVKHTQTAVVETANTDIANLNGKELGQFLDKLPLAEKVIADIKKASKEKLKEDSESIPGWTLQKGANRRTIIKPDELLFDLEVLGLKVKPKITISVAEVEKAIRKHTAEINLDDYIKTSTTAPSLRRRAKGGE